MTRVSSVRRPCIPVTGALLMAVLLGSSCEFKTEEKPPGSGGAEAEPRWSGIDELRSPKTEVRIKLSRAEGGGVIIALNRVPRADLNELAATLAAFVEMEPGLVIVIDAQNDIPFNWVFGALDACKRAKVKDVRFQAPPVEFDGGDNWWYE